MAKMHNLSIFARPITQRILHSLAAQEPICLSLVGGPLLGKSVLLAHIARQLSASDENPAQVTHIRCGQVSPGDSLPQRPEGDGRWPEGDGRWVVLLDDCDRMAEWPAETGRRWTEWLVADQPRRGLVLASRQPLYAGASRELAGAVPYLQQHFLGLIDGEEAARIALSGLGNSSAEGQMSGALVEWCGGHPFLLDRLAHLLPDVRGLIGGQPLGPAHLPLLRMRLVAVYGRQLFDRQWQAVEASSGAEGQPVEALLRLLLRRLLRFDELSPVQMEPMHWLLVQGLVAVESHGYRLFSPLLTDYLALRFGAGGASVPASQPETGAVQALVEREAHRFTPQEKSLMLYFLERPGTIVSVDELLADVWQKPDGSVRRVQEGIRRLRQRLAEFNGAVGTIDNEWGQGYRYVPVG